MKQTPHFTEDLGERIEEERREQGRKEEQRREEEQRRKEQREAERLGEEKWRIEEEERVAREEEEEERWGREEQEQSCAYVVTQPEEEVMLDKPFPFFMEILLKSSNFDKTKVVFLERKPRTASKRKLVI